VPEAATKEPMPLRACPHCEAPLQDEHQEICVECGSPAPERVRAARRAAPPIAVALFATLMAASAAYGLTANLGGKTPVPTQQVAAAPPPTATATAATPPPTSPPAATTPAPPPTPPASTTPAPAAKPSTPSPPAAAKPASPSAAGPSPSPSSTASPSTTTSTPSGGGGDQSTPKPARHHSRQHRTPSGPAWLSQGDQPYSASLYDPYANGADEHASAASKAVDGKPKTAWTTADHPGGLGKPGVGLVVETGGYQSYSAIGLQTATPGFKVSIYSTEASDPPAGGPQNGWKLEATNSSVGKQQRIRMKGATAQPTYLLVWITALPPGKPRAGLSEVTLLP